MSAQELLAWGALLTSVAAIMAIAKFWMDMGATKVKADNADERTERVAKDLADFKSVVAREYASVAQLAASETRLASAIEGIRGDFRGMTERIDRLLSVVQAQSH